MRCSAQLLRSGAPLIRDRHAKDYYKFRTIPGLQRTIPLRFMLRADKFTQSAQA
jgi:hypothetical protein